MSNVTVLPASSWLKSHLRLKLDITTPWKMFAIGNQMRRNALHKAGVVDTVSLVGSQPDRTMLAWEHVTQCRFNSRKQHARTEFDTQRLTSKSAVLENGSIVERSNAMHEHGLADFCHNPTSSLHPTLMLRYSKSAYPRKWDKECRACHSSRAATRFTPFGYSMKSCKRLQLRCEMAQCEKNSQLVCVLPK